MNEIIAQHDTKINGFRNKHGVVVAFKREKIENAIKKAAKETSANKKVHISEDSVSKVVDFVIGKINNPQDEFFVNVDEKGKRIVDSDSVKELVEIGIVESDLVSILPECKKFRKQKELLRKSIKVNGTKKVLKDITDASMLIVESITTRESSSWDASKIVSHLRSTGKISDDVSVSVAKTVEKHIINSGLKSVSTKLIREMVNNELAERGMKEELKDLSSYSIPKDFINNLMFSKSVENSNIGNNNPEAVNLGIAEMVLKQWALDTIYSKEVKQAHENGEIYVHDLGYPHRVYCSSHSLEYIKKYGLVGLLNLNTESKPAKSASVLTGHLNTYLASMQSNYAGALGIAYINIMYAPLLEGLDAKQLKQVAQELIFNGSQNAFNRGNQSVKGSENIYIYDRLENDLKLIPISVFYDGFNAIRDAGRYCALSLNRDSGKTELQDIYGAVQHKRDKKLVNVECGNGLSACVTKDHSLFTINDSGCISESKPQDNCGHFLTYKNFDISFGDMADIDLKKYIEGDDGWLLDDVKIWHKRFPGKAINRFIKINNDFAELLGLYVAEGGHSETCVSISIFETEKEKQKVSDLFMSVFGRSGIVGDEKVEFCSKLVLRMFVDLCGHRDYSKKVPTQILFNSPDIVRSFLAGYIAGDGCVANNRVVMVTVSEVLSRHLMLLLSKVGCIPRIADRQPMSDKIMGVLLKSKPKKQFIVSVGDTHLDGMYCTYDRKNILICQLRDKFNDKKEDKKYDQLNYDYNYLKESIKKVFRGKISLKCLDIKERKLLYVSRMVNNSLEKYECAGEITKQNIRSVMNDLYLYENIEPNGFQNISNKIFYSRDVESDNTFELGVQIINKQVDAMKELGVLLEKSLNILPVRIKSITESSEQDEFVYDISVRNNENFLLGNGLFAHNTLFLDFNIHSGVPSYLKDVPAIGPGGRYMLRKRDGSRVNLFEEVRKEKNYKHNLMDLYEISGENKRLVLREIYDSKKEEIIYDDKIKGDLLKNGEHVVTYGDYEKMSRDFAILLLEVWKEGDKHGRIFEFPKCDFHVSDETFKDKDQYEVFLKACELASVNGSTYFVFDRDAVTLSACCRLRTTISDKYVMRHPESMRFCGFQNITINIPQAAYRASRKNEKNLDGLKKELDAALDLAVKAHLQKKEKTKDFMSAPGKPLWQIGKTACDGKPYVDLEASTYIVGLIGVNDAVKFIVGKELHESDESMSMGLKIVNYMFLKMKQFTEKYGIKFSLEESPAESCSRKLAKIDSVSFKEESTGIIRGDDDNIYYTNSVHLSAEAPVSLVERIKKQSKFHSMIESGAIIHAFVGEEKPSVESIAKLIKNTFLTTQSAQLTISPEFTYCNDCSHNMRGLKDNCDKCGSKNVYHETRIVGYFSKIENWNKSKRHGELIARHKGFYSVEKANDVEKIETKSDKEPVQCNGNVCSLT
jgi:anaerobic ribonucleoside-triphosphate reductase